MKNLEAILGYLAVFTLPFLLVDYTIGTRYLFIIGLAIGTILSFISAKSVDQGLITDYYVFKEHKGKLSPGLNILLGNIFGIGRISEYVKSLITFEMKGTTDMKSSDPRIPIEKMVDLTLMLVVKVKKGKKVYVKTSIPNILTTDGTIDIEKYHSIKALKGDVLNTAEQIGRHEPYGFLRDNADWTKERLLEFSIKYSTSDSLIQLVEKLGFKFVSLQITANLDHKTKEILQGIYHAEKKKISDKITAEGKAEVVKIQVNAEAFRLELMANAEKLRIILEGEGINAARKELATMYAEFVEEIMSKKLTGMTIDKARLDAQLNFDSFGEESLHAFANTDGTAAAGQGGLDVMSLISMFFDEKKKAQEGK